MCASGPAHQSPNRGSPESKKAAGSALARRQAARRPSLPTPDPFPPPGPRSIPAPLVSLCVIARNEAATLGRCLESVRELADELIVVDTGSADATPEVARRAGARVISSVWEDDFSRARNRALD